MSLVTKNSLNNSSGVLLEIAYEIGEFTQSLAEKDSGYMSGSLCGYHIKWLKEGPNAYSLQTKQGLVLQEWEGFPFRIITPYGPLGVCMSKGEKVEWEIVMETLKQFCKLELIQEQNLSKGAYERRYWAITEWKGQKIETPLIRDQKDNISFDEVKKIWAEFVKTH